MTSDPRINLKRPWLAGILAFLIPGAGHLYQGRLFKAGAFFVSIMGLYVIGLILSGGQAIQPPSADDMQQGRYVSMLKFGAQGGVGAQFLIGMLQRQRALSPENIQVSSLTRPFSAPFKGVASLHDDSGIHSSAIQGTIFFEPGEAHFGKPTITGRVETQIKGKPATLKLGNDTVLGPPIKADKEREVVGSVLSVVDGRKSDFGHVAGTIPRSFVNWFSVPTDPVLDQDLNDKLGKFYELAMVFTWVAGLLNVLAIWDAVEGPAYGFGKREPESEVPPEPAKAA